MGFEIELEILRPRVRKISIIFCHTSVVEHVVLSIFPLCYMEKTDMSRELSPFFSVHFGNKLINDFL